MTHWQGGFGFTGPLGLCEVCGADPENLAALKAHRGAVCLNMGKQPGDEAYTTPSAYDFPPKTWDATRQRWVRRVG